jgi:hypothetical protein
MPMRKIVTLLALFVALSAGAQKSNSILLYGYMRPSHPGIVPANHPNATMAEYLIFIAHPKDNSFRVLTVSVAGKSYPFSTEKKESPVTYVNRNLPRKPRTITLVPANKGTVEQVALVNGPTRPGAGSLKVTYRLKGKSYTKTLSAWKELEPVMNL